MPNLASRLESNLSPVQLNQLRAAADAARLNGAEVYLVGGTVRDMLLSQAAVDLDISLVGGRPGFATALAEKLDGEVVAQSRFGTSKIRTGDTILDVANARSETYAHPGALPSIAPGTIHEDLARRDFALNAMAISLAHETWGDLLDPHSGAGDIDARVIRVLHPASLQDDATRILRAIRFAQRLGFRIEDSTEQLILRDLSYIDTISGDRIRHELQRVLVDPRAVSMLEKAQELGVISAIYRPLDLDKQIFESLGLVRIDSATETVLPMVALLAYSLPAGAQTGFIARLSMDTAWARVVRETTAVRQAFDRLSMPDLRPSEIYAALHQFGIQGIEACALAAKGTLVSRRLELYLTRLRQIAPELNGDDLIALGVQPGPMIGQLLKSILAALLNGEIRTRGEEEALVLLSIAEFKS